MSEQEMKEVLISILSMLKQQAMYLHRQHGWMISLADWARQSPEAREYLKQHPFYDQGPYPAEKITETNLRNIDALIAQLQK